MDDPNVEIVENIEALEKQIQELKDRIELLQLKKKHLRKRCTHPNAYTYKDYSGESNWYCPTCGLER